MEKTNPSDEMQKIENMMPENVKHVRSVLLDEHQMGIPDHCDQFIARCLRQKEGNSDGAVKLILAYHDTIFNLRQWNVTLVPSSGKEVYSTGIAVQMKMRDTKGRYITILQPGLWDPEEISFEQATAFLWMLLQHSNSELIEMQRNGFVHIWDYKGVSFQQVLAAKPGKILTMAKWAKNGVGGRFKELHVINLPKPAVVVYKAVRSFLSEKMKKRIFVHDSVADLLKHVDGKNLPTSVGGDLGLDECVDNNLIEGFFRSDQYFKDMMDAEFPSK